MKNKLKRINRISIIAVSIFFMMSCDFESKERKDAQHFNKVVSELMVVENLPEPDSLKAFHVKRIMENYNMTIAEFDSLLQLKMKDATYWKSVYQTIKKDLENETKVRNNLSD